MAFQKKDLKSRLGRHYANLRLRIQNKSQKIKALKQTGIEKLRNPKFIAHKAIIDLQTYESKFNWNLTEWTVIMSLGRSKTLIKLYAWPFFMNLENQE